MRSASAARAGSWARTASRARWAPATSVVASTLSGSSGLPASAACATAAAEASASACPSRSASAASSASSPGSGSTAAISLEPEAQQIGLLGPLARPCGQLLQLHGDSPQPPVGTGVLGQRARHRLTRVPVERLALPGRTQQALLVGLTVHRDEFVGELGEHPDRHRPPAEVRP